MHRGGFAPTAKLFGAMVFAFVASARYCIDAVEPSITLLLQDLDVEVTRNKPIVALA